MRISDWSSDVCSSDLKGYAPRNIPGPCGAVGELAFEVSQSSNSGIAAPGRLSPARWRQDLAASLHVAGLAVTAIEMAKDLVVERRFHRPGDGALIGGPTKGGVPTYIPVILGHTAPHP